MANADELNATLAVIEKNPQLWDQGTFYMSTECGAVACFDGWTLLRHGYTDLRGMLPEEIEVAAMRILGLNEWEHNALAYCFTTDFGALTLRVKEIIAGEWVDRADADDLVGW